MALLDHAGQIGQRQHVLEVGDHRLEIVADGGGVLVADAGEPGVFEAIVSVFGNVDFQGDRIIPGATGVLAYRRRATVTVRSLQMLISGTHDRTGAAAADRYEGLQTNVEYLVDNVVDPAAAGRSVRLGAANEVGRGAIDRNRVARRRSARARGTWSSSIAPASASWKTCSSTRRRRSAKSAA